jgi:hypothetical protein
MVIGGQKPTMNFMPVLLAPNKIEVRNRLPAMAVLSGFFSTSKRISAHRGGNA